MRRHGHVWVWVLGLVVATVVPFGVTSSASTGPTCAGRSATIVGTAGDDSIVGTRHADVIAGLSGDDRILGAGGNDVICGLAGNDRLRGGGGADLLVGGSADDFVRGGDGADRLGGGSGNDRLEGRAGPDVIDGGVGLDLCRSPAPPRATTCDNTTLVTVGATGGPADEETWDGQVVSGDGRYVVFASQAANLVADDANGHVSDVFIRDRLTGVTHLVSVADDGGSANGGSGTVTVSDDARYVVFGSAATNLVADGSNSGGLFLRDRQTQTTTRLLSAVQGPVWEVAVSADTRYVSFTSSAPDLVADDTNGVADIFVLDRQSGITQRVSVSSGATQATEGSGEGSMSANGRYVAFVSGASDLVPGDTNDHIDVFVRDLLTGHTTRVSVASDGSQVFADSIHPSISANGQVVAFESAAANLVAGDTNDAKDVFVHVQLTGDTRRVSVDSNGNQVYQPSVLDYYSDLGSRLSADGRYVVFQSSARHLVPGDTNGVMDAFVHDRFTGNTTRVSVATTEQQGDGGSWNPAISADGSTVAFNSVAENLVLQTTNEDEDVFVRIIH
jgi:Tol biopolymer transport system component